MFKKVILLWLSKCDLLIWILFASLYINLNDKSSVAISLSVRVFYWPNDVVEITKYLSCRRYFADVITSVRPERARSRVKYRSMRRASERCEAACGGNSVDKITMATSCRHRVESSLSLSVTRGRKFTSARVSLGD